MKKYKASSWFIFVTITLDAIGLGLVIPTLPEIIRRFTSDEMMVSNYYGYFVSLYALMQFLASPLLGALSDKYGRRPVLLISLIGASLDYVLMAFAPTLFILFLGRIISGLTGASISVASAYMVDVSDDKTRAGNFGMIGAAFGLGFIIGPAIGGLLGYKSAHYPFLFAALLTFLNFLFGLFVLPESLPKEQRRNVDLKKMNPFTSVIQILKPSPILSLVVVFILFQIAHQIYPSNWALYTQHKFSWSAAEIGMSLTAFGILSAISQGWGARVFIPKIGETRAVKIGALGECIAFFLYSFALTGTMIYPIMLFSSLFWISMPALQSLISKDIPSSEQGELQGALVSVTSVTAIVVPIIVTHMFGIFSVKNTGHYFPGVGFAFGATIYLAAWAIMLKLKNNNVSEKSA